MSGEKPLYKDADYQAKVDASNKAMRAAGAVEPGNVKVGQTHTDKTDGRKGKVVEVGKGYVLMRDAKGEWETHPTNLEGFKPKAGQTDLAAQVGGGAAGALRPTHVSAVKGLQAGTAVRVYGKYDGVLKGFTEDGGHVVEIQMAKKVDTRTFPPGSAETFLTRKRVPKEPGAAVAQKREDRQAKGAKAATDRAARIGVQKEPEGAEAKLQAMMRGMEASPKDRTSDLGRGHPEIVKVYVVNEQHAGPENQDPDYGITSFVLLRNGDIVTDEHKNTWKVTPDAIAAEVRRHLARKGNQP